MNRQQQIDHFVAQAHQLAMQRLREQPGRVGEVRAQLAHWRQLAGPTRSDVYWNEWDSLLAGPLDVLADTICTDNDHATVLRSVSPMSVLITQTERMQLLTAARHAA